MRIPLPRDQDFHERSRSSNRCRHPGGHQVDNEKDCHPGHEVTPPLVDDEGKDGPPSHHANDEFARDEVEALEQRRRCVGAQVLQSQQQSQILSRPPVRRPGEGEEQDPDDKAGESNHGPEGPRSSKLAGERFFLTRGPSPASGEPHAADLHDAAFADLIKIRTRTGRTARGVVDHFG